MIVDIPDGLYGCARQQCRDYLNSPEEQIEFWSRLGKAILDNPQLEVTMTVELVLAQMQGRTLRPSSDKTADYCEHIIESAYFLATRSSLPPQTHTGVVRKLLGLLEDDSSACRLRGELSEFSFFQWCDEFQLFQLGFERDDTAGSLTALSLARKYVGK